MRKFTKCLMTLCLLCIAGVASAKETVVYSLDYSTMADQEGAPFYAGLPDGASISIKNGLLVIDNTSDAGDFWSLQYAIGSGFATTENNDYKINITYNTTKAGGGGVWVAFGNWDVRETNYGVTLQECAADEFKTFTWTVSAFSSSAAGNFVLMQSRGFVGKISIKKVEVIEIEADGPEPTLVSVITNGDLEGTDASCFSSTQSGTGGPWMVTIEDGIGKDGSRGIKVVSVDIDDLPSWQYSGEGDAYQWCNQFFISSKYKLPKGTKVRLKFNYKASVAGDAAIQAHGAPGAYNDWNFLPGLSFTDEWQTYDETKVLNSNTSKDDNLFYTAAFNLGLNKVATTFYFDNIVMEAGVVNTETMDGFELSPAIPVADPKITIGAAGAATIYPNYSMKVDENVTAYAVTYDDVNKKVELVKVTEIPVNNAVLVEGAAGTYPQKMTNVLSLGTANDLKGSDGKIKGNGSIYVLANKGKGVGFYKLKSGETVPYGKGYLEITAPTAPEFLGLNGETTAIKALEKAVDNGAIFNLNGQQVDQPNKGLYIVNGKKVVLK